MAKYPTTEEKWHGRVTRFLAVSHISQSQFARVTTYPRPNLCDWLNKGAAKYLNSTTIDLFDKTIQTITRERLKDLMPLLPSAAMDALEEDTGLAMDNLMAFADGGWLDPDDCIDLADKLFNLAEVSA